MGGLLFTQVDMTNPYDNYNNVAPANNTIVPIGSAVPCGGDFIGSPSVPGGYVDCSGINDTFIQNALTCTQSYCPYQGTQTIQNQHFNTMLDGYASYFFALQGAGAAIGIEPFSEQNNTPSWFNTNVSNANQIKLWDYMQDYWEQHSGLHNLLYIWGILSSNFCDYAAYPGNNRVDMISIHAFPIGQTLTPIAGYSSCTDLAGGLSSLGKPMAFGAYGELSAGDQTYDYSGLAQTIKNNMPLVTYLSFWWGYNPGTGSGVESKAEIKIPIGSA